MTVIRGEPVLDQRGFLPIVFDECEGRSKQRPSSPSSHKGVIDPTCFATFQHSGGNVTHVSNEMSYMMLRHEND